MSATLCPHCGAKLDAGACPKGHLGGPALARTAPAERPYWGEVFVAVALDRVGGFASIALLAVRADGARKLVVEQPQAQGTANQAVARGLLLALDRLDKLGVRGNLLTNLSAAVPGAGANEREVGTDFPGLIALVARRCAAMGSAVAFCKSDTPAMDEARQAAQLHQRRSA